MTKQTHCLDRKSGTLSEYDRKIGGGAPEPICASFLQWGNFVLYGQNTPINRNKFVLKCFSNEGHCFYLSFVVLYKTIQYQEGSLRTKINMCTKLEKG